MAEDTTKIEEKLKIDNDILVAKRQYKLVFQQLEDLKSEYNQVATATEKKKELLDSYKTELTEVLNDVSNARLSWAVEKDEEWQKINNKKTEVDNILKRSSELDKKEEDLKKIEQKDTDIRNETRRLELKIEQDKTILSSKEKDIATEKDNIKKEKEDFIKEKEQFKDKIIKQLKEWQTKF